MWCVFMWLLFIYRNKIWDWAEQCAPLPKSDTKVGLIKKCSFYLNKIVFFLRICSDTHTLLLYITIWCPIDLFPIQPHLKRVNYSHKLLYITRNYTSKLIQRLDNYAMNYRCHDILEWVPYLNWHSTETKVHS